MIERERQRFDILVMGHDRPAAVITGSVRRRGKRRMVRAAVSLEPGVERALSLRERWSHKANGTPETLERAEIARTHQDGLAQLEANGTISNEQREWAAQIANVYRSLESDVALKVASLEARVDGGSRAPAVAERIHRVRMHHAYTIWRGLLPAPKALVLDMIVGDFVGYSVAAARHRVHPRKAKRLLLAAINAWPACVARAFSVVDDTTLNDMNRAVVPWRPELTGMPVANYQAARHIEAGRERTDEPYLLPPIDPAFLDERGYLLPWSDIAAIVRQRVFGEGGHETP